MGELFDQVCQFETLTLAAKRAFKGKQRKARVMNCLFHQETEIFELQNCLRSGDYQPEPYRYFTVYEPKTREIAAAHIKDRIVHHAICHVLGHHFDSVMLSNSYACRKTKGQHKAIQKAQKLSQKYQYVLKFDVRKYFASIDHGVLLGILEHIIPDEALFKLCKSIIQYPLLLSTGDGRGLPIGSLTSQYFANLYLNVLDWYIAESLGELNFLRYMDDVLIFSDSKATLWGYLEEIEAFLRSDLKLELKHSMTQVLPVSEGINYLGMRIFPRTIRLQHKTKSKFIRKMYQNKNRDSIAASVAHVSHASTLRLRQKVFSGQIGSG
ncbi:MAG: RNA-dependent DNA polymerase [Methylococcales bacterium]|jgi:RNA-directed DNA polymerase|nr:RNA-dependent DNA polymerase [Methylococcales bacterium]MBT7442942.1 RNA-dependent DNA polymerase [Methylococcales bacterium]